MWPVEVRLPGAGEGERVGSGRLMGTGFQFYKMKNFWEWMEVMTELLS